MCRLMGIFSKEEFSIENQRELIENFKAIAKQDRTIGHTHADGWGLAWLEDNSYRIFKNTKPIWEDEIPQNITSRSYIIHARKASVGRVDINNTHPFQIGDLILAHNGHINSDIPTYSHKPLGDTDSESLLALLTDLYEGGYTIETALSRILQGIGNDFYAINLIIGSLKERAFWILNYYNDIDDVHNLHYTIRYKVDDDKLIVASEPIDNDEWKELSRTPRTPVLMKIPIENPLDFKVFSLKQSISVPTIKTRSS